MPTPSPSRKREGGDSEMRYLPLTPDDRTAMLAAVGASSIDDLFADVPPEARLDGPISGLPLHASELAVERHMAALSRRNRAAGGSEEHTSELQALMRIP